MAEKISPDTIERSRVQEWLRRNASLPLRALIAPAGYGKTAAIVRYLGAIKERHAFVRAHPGDSAANLARRIAEAFELSGIATFDELCAALSEQRECTIAVDALDLATPEAIAEIAAFALECPWQIRVIVAGCRLQTIHTPRLFVQGVAAMLGASSLAFTDNDVATLCKSLGVECGDADVRALVTASDGWPMIASAVVRAAASDRRPLHGAYEIWLASSANVLRQFVEGEINRAPERAKAIFARAAHGELLLDEEWIALENDGLFAREDDGAHRLLHPIGALYARGPRFGRSASPQRLTIALFGEFDVSYGGTAVKWLRRRDLEIVRLLCARPGGTATRAELLERFWPATERRAAQQSLRTSCSNVRKAIAGVVGATRVDRYFTCGTDITLNANAISLDAHRFLSHVHSGDEAFEALRTEIAAAHYRAALRLRRGAPAIDEHDEQHVRLGAMLEDAFSRAQRRLIELGSTPEAVRRLGSSDRAAAGPSSRAAS